MVENNPAYSGTNPPVNPAENTMHSDSESNYRILIEIGRALGAEKDPKILLGLILNAARRITGADGGSIFLIENSSTGQPLLRLSQLQNASRKIDFKEFTIQVDRTSIAGFVALTGCTLSIPDTFKLGQVAPWHVSRAFDQSCQYKTISMLTVPLWDYTGKVSGIVQLVNSKKPAHDDQDAYLRQLETMADFDEIVVPFKDNDICLMEAVAAQAGMALENVWLIKNMRRQFEAFVRASVMAIESRDPPTRGHSERVSRMAVALMSAVQAETQGPYRDTCFTNEDLKAIEFSGLLHDYGKVYLDSRIFLKSRKLYPEMHDRLVLRIKFLCRSLELDYAHRQMAMMRRGLATDDLAGEGIAAVKELLSTLSMIDILNQPIVLDHEPERQLHRIIQLPLPDSCRDYDGSLVPILDEEEIRNLSIRKGSLNEEERKIIQSHVELGYEFVSQIPWPHEYQCIPEWCRCHHEALDGSGYPRGLKGDAIPLASRILSVCDIFDALTAADRPYKAAMPFKLCRTILAEEASARHLDAELVRIFFATGCYKV